MSLSSKAFIIHQQRVNSVSQYLIQKYLIQGKHSGKSALGKPDANKKEATEPKTNSEQSLGELCITVLATKARVLDATET